jgi:DNA-binding transcriptional regulator YbjK
MNARLSPRGRLVGDAAISVLADHGARGLTHRAVDQAAGLPPGTTSNHARTRAALLTLTLARIAELDAADGEDVATGMQPAGASPAGAALAGEGPARARLASAMASLLDRMITVPDVRRRVVARFELALEATRRPELRTAYNEMGGAFRAQACQLLAAAGSAQPERDAWTLIAWLEGTAFYALAGAGTTALPTPDQLTSQLTRLLTGMCGDDPSAA